MRDLHICSIIVKIYATYVLHISIFVRVVSCLPKILVKFVFDCVGNENYTGIAARDTANALAVLAHAVRGVAAGTNNTQTQGYILSTAQQVSLSHQLSLCFM